MDNGATEIIGVSSAIVAAARAAGFVSNDVELDGGSVFTNAREMRQLVNELVVPSVTAAK